MNSRWLVRGFVIAALAGAPALAQQMFIYPAKGQSPAQQQKDDHECHAWAVQQTGYDPTRPQAAAAPAAPAGPAPGSGLKGAARGALVGGAIGGSDGAGAGAVIGGIAGRQKSKAQQQQQQQQQQASAQAAGPNAYNRARAGCLTGRGYTVS